MGSNFSSLIVKPYLITLSDEADVFPTFQNAGIETIYMLESEVDYRHGDNVYQLKPGNTFFFDANTPPGADDLEALPAHYLFIISCPQDSKS